MADNGLFSHANVVACAQVGIEPLLAIRQGAHHEPLVKRFAPPHAPLMTDPVANMVHRLSTHTG